MQCVHPAAVRTWAVSLTALLAAASLALAQNPAPGGTALPDVPEAVEPPALPSEAEAPAPRIWLASDYLLGWMKNSPIKVPVATTTTDTALTTRSGTLGQSGTRVVIGDAGLDYGTMSGLRLSAGGWWDADRRVGVESVGTLFEQRSAHAEATSDAQGRPLVAVPFQTPSGDETAHIVSMPAVGPIPPLVGGITVTANNRLGSLETNGLLNLARTGTFAADLLAGLRYLGLDEDMHIVATSHLNAGAAGTLNQTTTDQFDTRNQFAGGQLGSRVGYHVGAFAVDVRGLIAFGATYQTVNVNGFATANGTGMAGGLFPALSDGGVFTQPSNSGRTSRSDFAVVPEMQVRLTFGLARHIRTYVGYNFLYWSSVVRPGDQIDRVINPSQSATLGGTGTLSGVARPTTLFNQSDLWAQGANLGFELGW